MDETRRPLELRQLRPVHSSEDGSVRKGFQNGCHVLEARSLHCPTVQRKGSDSEMVKALEEVVALGGEEKIELVPLKKARVSHHVRGVAIEQTDITMEGLPGAVWRSVCVEGELQDIIRILRERVGGTSGDASLAEHLVRVAEGGMACGYPEFIAKLKEKSKQATCK